MSVGLQVASTTSLPSYHLSPTFSRTPSYTAEPQANEHRLALTHILRPRPSGEFIKHSKHGGVSLRLTAQEDGVELPEYGSGNVVEGTITLSKPESVLSVDVKIEGVLQLKEVAEGGTTSVTLCLDKATLFSRGSSSCPAVLPFSLLLPPSFSDGRSTYPLPPTYEVHLSGLPGFRSTIEYSVSVTVGKGKAARFGLGNTTVSTHFIYHPRTRPSTPLPLPLQSGPGGFVDNPDWKVFDTIIRTKERGGKDIAQKLYIPASRVFSLKEPIPFYLTLTSSAYSLASFLPFGPISMSLAPGKRYTRIQVVRQSVCDVRGSVIMGTKTDIWRVDTIGEGVFRRAADGPDWISFEGEIAVSDLIKVGGFKAGGLFVKDCIVLTLTPPKSLKCPFHDSRQVVPIRLTTDPWSIGGSGDLEGPQYSEPSDDVHAQPELNYYYAE
ncbi:hypothetical protein JAAARDRAFT_171170 [Jaapia argillacea MUCL 33604]|uniref:Arrestin-like N-terminal domain-containing protein n=1 Tax=Jaapia argillacea MUCL 33604 TaxID=933084 RepID=A0A067Q6P1_9AGAM|nr:hypothetical protein JAAARDRAFT_171170 [Jaapia argillacea MUCL 33604]